MGPRREKSRSAQAGHPPRTGDWPERCRRDRAADRCTGILPTGMRDALQAPVVESYGSAIDAGTNTRRARIANPGTTTRMSKSTAKGSEHAQKVQRNGSQRSRRPDMTTQRHGLRGGLGSSIGVLRDDSLRTRRRPAQRLAAAASSMRTPLMRVNSSQTNTGDTNVAYCQPLQRRERRDGDAQPQHDLARGSWGAGTTPRGPSR